MSVRIIKQKQEQQIKTSLNGDLISTSPVLIESMLLLMPDQSQTPIISFEKSRQPTSSTVTMNDFEPSRVLSTFDHSSTAPSTTTANRRSAAQRVHVPIQNASQWFNGPDMQNERTGRMEKIVASLVHRSYRPLSTYAYVIYKTN
jgi:hypothetical protein